MMDEPTISTCYGERASRFLKSLDLQVRRKSAPANTIPTKLPQISPERLSDAADGKTILYLAYGSNLSAETFKGNRGIEPISAVNVHVPSLNLTFDLAGIPYTEPCFANTSYRKIPTQLAEAYEECGWHKGLVGVVYEVTPEDYRTIIATEGGGASYTDITVECYVLPAGKKTVDAEPSGVTFKAHTLYSPRDGNKASRPDPTYAQASARYLKLLTDGGDEHNLPDEYMAYLYNLKPYTITTYRQTIGKYIFATLWMPIILALFGLGKVLADKGGRLPAWLAKLYGIVFWALWVSYDNVFRPLYGDGERTIEKGDEEAALLAERKSGKINYGWCEKRDII